MGTITLEPSDFPNSNGHEWVKIKSDNILDGKHSCRNCGFLRKPDDTNKPCRGKVKITLR